MDVFVFLTELVGKRVYDADGRRRGRVVDFAADAREPYPRVGYFVCGGRGGAKGRKVRIAWEQIARLEKDGVHLLAGAPRDYVSFERRPGEVLLVADLLDKQVVDVNGAKVERVNDIHFLNTERDLRVVHVDVGFRGLLRRLGLLGPFDALTRWLFSFTVEERFINWRFVQPLGEQLAGTGLQLNVARARLAALHPADLADIIEDLPQPERATVFAALDVETAAEALEEVEDAELAVDLLEAVGEERAGEIIEEMDPDEAADVLAEFDDAQAEELIEAMEDERAEDLRELLAQDEGTAGAIMTTEYLAVRQDDEVAAAFKVLRSAEDVEAYNYVYVIDDDGVLVGVVSLRDALLAKRKMPVTELMTARVITAQVDEPPARVCELFGKYGFATLPVVDGDGVLRGVITLYDAVAAVYPEFEKE